MLILLHSYSFEACGHRRFGNNCTSVCHCLQNTSCDAVSGQCHNGACNPGWQSASCDKSKFHNFEIKFVSHVPYHNCI